MTWNSNAVVSAADLAGCLQFSVPHHSIVFNDVVSLIRWNVFGLEIFIDIQISELLSML